MSEAPSSNPRACEPHGYVTPEDCPWCKVERLTDELNDAMQGEADATEAYSAENRRLRAALERIAIGDSTDYPWAKNVAREALAGEDRPRMPPMDSRMRSEVNRGTVETDAGQCECGQPLYTTKWCAVCDKDVE